MADVTYTVGYLIDRTFDLLLGAAREDMNVASAHGAGDTTISWTYTAGRANQGTYIAIDDEVMYVWAA